METTIKNLIAAISVLQESVTRMEQRVDKQSRDLETVLQVTIRSGPSSPDTLSAPFELSDFKDIVKKTLSNEVLNSELRNFPELHDVR